jgi:hypothetical protein
MNWRLPHARIGACLTAAAVTLSTLFLGINGPVAFAQTEYLQPAVPENIQVPAGNTLFLVGHATGTQDYVCLPSGSDFKFALVTPRATLLGGDRQQVANHFFSPDPFDSNALRATWQESPDTDTVWAQAVQSSSDPAFVAPGAIGWVLLRAAGTQGGGGPEGLAATTYVQRLNTTGGAAPSTGCAASGDVGSQAFVPYTADYYFYQDDAGMAHAN